MRSNCFVYAVRKWAKDPRHIVGLQLVHVCRWLWLPRFWWISCDLSKAERFEPLHPGKGWLTIAHKIWFKGFVKLKK